MNRKELERYFIREQGWLEDDVKQMSLEELKEAYVELTNEWIP